MQCNSSNAQAHISNDLSNKEVLFLTFFFWSKFFSLKNSGGIGSVELQVFFSALLLVPTR